MERVYERCYALDVQKEQVTACVHVPDQTGERSESSSNLGVTDVTPETPAYASERKRGER